MTDLSALGRPFALQPDEGEASWFLDTLMTLKAGQEATRSAYTLIEFQAPRGFAPPAHIHHTEDEAFYVLDGTLQVTCGDRTWEVGPGGFAFLPRGVPHVFNVVGGETARALQLTSPAGFERFVAEVGQPADAAVLPPPAEPDVPRLLAAAARHDIEILPPGH